MGDQNYKNSGILGIVVAYFLVYVVWGSTYFFIGVALNDFPPFLLGALRFTTAGMILLMVCYLRGERVFSRQLVARSAVSGVVLLFIDMAVVMLAQQYLTSSFVAIVASSTALWIILLDVPRWKINFRNGYIILGSIVGFAGVAMLYIEQLHLDVFSNSSGRGVALLLCGCISWAIGTLYTKYCCSEAEGQNAFAGAAWQMVVASAMFWICSVAGGDLAEINFGAITTKSWLSLVYLVLFGSLLAYSAYVWLLKIRPAAEVGTHAYVNPFIAVILGVLLGGESVSWLQFTGLIVILAGVMFVSRQYKI